MYDAALRLIAITHPLPASLSSGRPHLTPVPAAITGAPGPSNRAKEEAPVAKPTGALPTTLLITASDRVVDVHNGGLDQAGPRLPGVRGRAVGRRPGRPLRGRRARPRAHRRRRRAVRARLRDLLHPDRRRVRRARAGPGGPAGAARPSRRHPGRRARPVPARPVAAAAAGA